MKQVGCSAYRVSSQSGQLLLALLNATLEFIDLWKRQEEVKGTLTQLLNSISNHTNYKMYRN